MITWEPEVIKKLEALFERDSYNRVKPRHTVVVKGGRRKQSALEGLAWAELDTEAFIEKLAERAWAAEVYQYSNDHCYYGRHSVKEASIRKQIKRVRKLPPPETEYLVQRVAARAKVLLDEYCESLADEVKAILGSGARITKADESRIQMNLPGGTGPTVIKKLKAKLGGHRKRRCSVCGRTDHDKRSCTKGADEELTQAALTVPSTGELINELEETKSRLHKAEDLLERIWVKADADVRNQIEEFLGKEPSVVAA